MKKVLIVFGTRPEAIKMVPVIQALRQYPDFEVKVCSTGQHRQMLSQVLKFFNLQEDFNLNVMMPNQTLSDITCKVLKGLEQLFIQWRPDIVLVQGDTTSATAAALAAFYHKIEVGHIEAGLRTSDRTSPYPEEMNRLLTTQLSTLHFAPTVTSLNNLLKEGIDPKTIHVTGNTVIDALFEAREILDRDTELRRALDEKFSFLSPEKKLILVTGHRRENFGGGFRQICDAIQTISARQDVQLVYPVHLNPNVRQVVSELLSSSKNIFLIDPQDYPAFLYLMRRSYLILTDSGGVQEEAPSLGKPVIVMRDTTERPEAVTAGTVILSGANKENICQNAFRLLDDQEFYKEMARAINPYGDGKAAARIADLLK